MLELQSLRSQLDYVKVAFDDAIIHGSSFSEVREIYMQIKVLEKAILERELKLLNEKRNKSHSL